MKNLLKIAEAFDKGKKQYESIMASDECCCFSVTESYSFDNNNSSIENVAGFGDNLEFMEYLIKKKSMAGKLRLIYIDPPFFTNSRYQASVRLYSENLGKSSLIKTGAYDDFQGRSLSEYLAMLTVRLFMIRELLSEDGALWIHLDWHSSHYVKLLLDSIFGTKNFINEVIWTYKSGGTSRRCFAKKHDTLFFYAKTPHYKFNPLKEKSYNRGLKPYRFKDVQEFKDDKGWYTNVNMKDVWNIDMVGRTSSERTGYATQKPEKLIERIVKSCSDEGDLCADFFSGSGSFGAVCGKLKRKWLMCDRGGIALSDQICRMYKEGQSFVVLKNQNDANIVGGMIRAAADDSSIHIAKYEFNEDISCSDMETVRRFYKDDSRSLIKCWSIDDDFDGITHKASRLYDVNDKTVQLNKTFKKGSISIVGYDVFGKEIRCLI